MTHSLAALIAGVPRYSIVDGPYGPFMGRATSGEYLHVSEVLAALEAAPVPDLVEAGKVLETLRGVTLTAFPANLAEVTDNAADTIRALIALATARAAQIAGLEAQLTNTLFEAECEGEDKRDAAYSAAEWQRRAEAATAEAATLRAEVERLRGALGHIESMAVHSGGEIHGVTAQHWKAAFEEAREIARAAREGKA